MFRRLAFLLAPRWLLLYGLVVVSVIAMVLLGKWQLTRAHENHGSMQNYSYVLQWWAFSTFVVFMLVRVMRDAIRHRDRGDDAPDDIELAVEAAAAPVAYRRYQPPQNKAADLDETQQAYNNYLASLATPGEAARDSP